MSKFNTGAEDFIISKHLRNRTTIFLFHEIGTQPSKFQQLSGTFMHLEKFEELLDWITNSFSVVSINSVIMGESSRKRQCVLTFDDSWKGAVTLGAESLARRKLPATFFLNASVLDGDPDLAAFAYLEHPGTQWPVSRVGDELRVSFYAEAVKEFSGETARWEEIERLDPDLFTLGNHLYWHTDTASGTVAEFEENLVKNKERLIRFQNFSPILAFPYGRQNKHFGNEHLLKAESIGIKRAFSSNAGSNGDTEKYLLRRTAPIFEESPREVYSQIFRADLRSRITKIPKSVIE